MKRLEKNPWVLSLTLLAFAACQKSLEPSSPPPPPPPTSSIPEAARTDAPVIAARGASALPAEPAIGKKPRSQGKSSATGTSTDPSAPDPPSEEDRVRSGGSTRGKISCGDAQCSPGKELCIAEAGWKCVATSALPSDPGDTLACDDGTDCPFGQTCCFSFASAVSERVCTKRRGPESDCRVEVCAEGGAPCPKGQVCDHSVCRSPNIGATCRRASVLGPSPNKKNWRCPPEHPICSWSTANTLCVSRDEHEAKLASEERSGLVCTIPSDCGPDSRCCTNGIWTGTQCLTNCDASNNGEVCASDADCTSFAGKPAKGKCVTPSDVKTLPPWLKVCSFE